MVYIYVSIQDLSLLRVYLYGHPPPGPVTGQNLLVKAI